MMTCIKNYNTKPEVQVRRMLEQSGFCYRLHSKQLSAGQTYGWQSTSLL